MIFLNIVIFINKIIMKNLLITEDEKNRILGLHKNHILSEQGSADINIDRTNRAQLQNAPVKKETVYPMDKEKQLVTILPKFGYTKKTMDTPEVLKLENPKEILTVTFVRKNSKYGKIGEIKINRSGSEDAVLSNSITTSVFKENPNTFSTILTKALDYHLY